MTHTLTDKEYQQLTISVAKALNSYEMPVKSKHARATIISTYHSNGGNLFWVAVLKQPLQENRITAWKCCYLLHKVLREGHHLVPQHSMRQRQMLIELGKLWGHLNDGYGLCIKHYTKLIVTKLNFHDRNPRIPGNIVLRKGELEKMAGGDINFHFQLAIEMFDYLDDIIALQATIFNSMNQFGVSSMTTVGQLRLTPLIPCIQDSNQLYDFSVRLMFLLHANLPEDLMTGHRERFRTIFKQLNNFYKQAGQLQYFTTLIKVPQLPRHQPNFLQQSDLGNYTAPVVVVPESAESEQDTNSIVGDLVDMSPEPEQAPEIPPRMKTPPPLPPIDFDRLLKERDELIRHLQHEMEKLHQISRQSNHQKQEFENRMQEEVARARSELSHTQEQLTNMRIEKQEIEMKLEVAESQSMEQQKSMVDEEKAKASEEKFQKLKNMYTQIRDEHIKLLRQHGEVSKQLAEKTRDFTEVQQDNEKMKNEIEESRLEKSKVEESMLQSSNMIEKEKEIFTEKIGSIESERKRLQAKLEETERLKNSELDEMKLRFEEKVRELDILNAKLNEHTENFKVAEEKLLQSSNEVSRQRESIEEQLKNVQSENEQLNNMIRKEKEIFTEKITSIECERAQLQAKLEENEKLKISELDDMRLRFEEKVRELDILNAKLTEHTENFKVAEEKLLQSSNEVSRQRESIEEQLKKVQSENEKLNDQLTALESSKNVEIGELQQQCNEGQTQLKEITGKSANEVESLKQQIDDHEKNYQQTMSSYDRVMREKENIEVDFQDLMHQQEMVEQKNLEIIQRLEQEKLNAKIHGDIQIRTLLEACIKTSENITMRAIADCEAGACGTSTYFIMIAEELQDVLTKLKLVHENYVKDGDNNMEALVRKVQSLGHLMSSIHEQGMTICNKSTNIENGEKIVNEFKDLGSHTSKLFKSLYTPEQTVNVSDNVEALKSQLFKITSMIGDLTSDNDVIEKLGDLVEKELSSMDKAIEEAAQKIVEMLQQTKTTDSGIKLEVNEKILDACTDLMLAIKILVQKSRKVQKEIIEAGKGTASSKEFYKRNHQWTEGLISASKSVANGAKILVEAANKAVAGESNHTFDVIVAAQEISACVAQLVVASRVKAPKSSQNVHELSDASKVVTQRTGFVVATAKDCIQKLEDGQEIDFSKLSPHQAKTREMEIQVKVLEYEKLLETERMKLSALRKQNYQSE